MRTLSNWRQSKINGTSIHEGKVLNVPADCYYERFSTIITKYGYVTAIQFNWKTNSGRIYFTQFETIVDGIRHSADIPEANLSDRNLKYMACRFLKTLKEKAAPIETAFRERPVGLSDTNIINLNQ